MALIRWDPFREMTSLQNEVNRLVRRAGGPSLRQESWMPSVDVVETNDATRLKAELAGMKPEDINLELQDNVLTLSGERRFEEEVHEDSYYRIERRHGTFSRSIALPADVAPEKIEAKFENGILEVIVPKTEEEKLKRITTGVTAPETVEAKATGREP